MTVSPKSTKSKTPFNSTRPTSKVVRLGLVAIIILAPVTIWVSFQNYDLNVKETPSPIDEAALRLDREKTERFFRLVQKDVPTKESLSPEFVRMANEKNSAPEELESAIVRVEQERCKIDPHLAMALKNLRDTPLAGPNPVLRVNQLREYVKLFEILVKDYDENSSEPEELKKRAGSLFKEFLEGLWLRTEKVGYDDIVALTSEESDPLLWYCVLSGIHGDDYLPTLRKAEAALERRKSHPLLKALILSNFVKVSESTTPVELGRSIEASIEAIGDVFQTHQDDKPMVNFTFDLLAGYMGGLGITAHLEIVSSFSKRSNPAIPDWIVNYTIARAYNLVSSNYRGGEFISRVSPDNLRLFEEYATLAANHLHRAWIDAPHVHQLASALMENQFRSGVTARSTDIWFRHSLSALLDDRSNFTADVYRISCSPRWGGSERKLNWLANKLVDCVGLESDLPFCFVDSILTYSQDFSHTIRLNDREVVSAVKKMIDWLKQRTETAPHPAINGTRTALIARVLWDANLLDDLHWFLDHYSSKAIKDFAHHLRFDFDIVKKVSKSANGEAAKLWSTINDQLFHGSTAMQEEKIAELREIVNRAESLALDEDAKEVVQTAKTLLQWIITFQRGDELAMDFSEFGGGWICHPTVKQIDSKMVEISIDPFIKPVLLMPWIRFDQPFQVQCEIQVILTEGIEFDDQWGVALQTGPSELKDIHLEGRELRFVANGNKADWDRIPRNLGAPPYCKTFQLNKPLDKYTLRIDHSPTYIRGFIDGVQLAGDRGRFENHGIMQIGRNATYEFPELTQGKPNVVYRISNVRIKKWVAE